MRQNTRFPTLDGVSTELILALNRFAETVDQRLNKMEGLDSTTPTFFNEVDMQEHRIRNLEDPIDGGDAVPLRMLRDFVGAVEEGGGGGVVITGGTGTKIAAWRRFDGVSDADNKIFTIPLLPARDDVGNPQWFVIWNLGPVGYSPDIPVEPGCWRIVSEVGDTTTIELGLAPWPNQTVTLLLGVVQ